MGSFKGIAAGAVACVILTPQFVRADAFGAWSMPDYGARRPVPHAAAPVEQGWAEDDWQPSAPRQAGRPQWRAVSPSAPTVANGGERPAIEPIAPPIVMVEGAYAVGTILIDTSARTLYRINGDGTAFAYPIGVGREGFAWSGTEKVARVADWPDWHPPQEMRARQPGLPEKMTGGIRNPLGAKAIYLGSSLYRIHGTDTPNSVGRAESSGCIRMLNEHATHLAALVSVGSQVIVTPALPPSFVIAQVPKPVPARFRVSAQ